MTAMTRGWWLHCTCGCANFQIYQTASARVLWARCLNCDGKFQIEPGNIREKEVRE